MRTRGAWAGKWSLIPLTFLEWCVCVADRSPIDRTMIWAIDLDDGTLIEDLGKNLNRKKSHVYGPLPDMLPCYGGTLQQKQEL